MKTKATNYKALFTAAANTLAVLENQIKALKKSGNKLAAAQVAKVYYAFINEFQNEFAGFFGKNTCGNVVSMVGKRAIPFFSIQIGKEVFAFPTNY